MSRFALRAALPNTTITQIDDEVRDEDWQYNQRDLWSKGWYSALYTPYATHTLFCSDDLIVHPNLERILHDMIEVYPGEIIGLISNHPDAPDDSVWYSTNAWLTGPAYIMPRTRLSEFCAWLRTYRGSICGDDALINEFVTHGNTLPHRVIHPTWSPVQHNVDIPSIRSVGGDPTYSIRTLSHNSGQADMNWDAPIVHVEVPWR